MAAQDLTTKAAVRSFLQKPTGDTGQDALVDSLITRASETIMRWAQREFAPKTDDATRVFTNQAGHMLDLAPYDLRSIDSITLDTDAASTSQTALTAVDWALRPKPAKDGTYQYVRLLNHPSMRLDREVTIAGDWGFASVPSDVEHWCIVTVATWLRRDVTAFESTFNVDEARLDRPEALPAAVRAGLAHYRRVAAI